MPITEIFYVLLLIIILLWTIFATSRMIATMFLGLNKLLAMASYVELYNNLNNAVSVGSPERAKTYFREHLRTHCFHPQTLSIRDSLTGEVRSIQVPCGKCQHCVDQRIAEWVTRLYAHLESFKHCYFVTLTYRSFTPAQVSDKSHPYSLVLDYLKDALWNLDSFNTTKNFAYSPCVLVKRHYQLFLKRLRKNTGIKNISFVVSGEYGETMGRPHFHLLLFSNDPLTLADCRRAWSLGYTIKDGVCVFAPKRCSNSYRIVFGNVKFDDLVQNGTITNENIVVDGAPRSARSCFAYVCKYIHKSGLIPKSLFPQDSEKAVGLRYFNDLRLRLAHNNLNELYTYYETNHTLLDKLNKSLYHVYFDLFKNDDFESSYRVFDADYRKYYRSYLPFKESSRGVAIGSIYASLHIEKFANGIFPRPSLQTVGFVVPAYFKRKASSFLFGLQSRSPYSSDVSFTNGIVAKFIADCSLLDADRFAVRYGLDISLYNDLGSLLNSRYAFKDSYTGYRYLIVCDPLAGAFVPCYKFNRSSRSYVCLKYYTLDEFVSMWLGKYITAMQIHKTKLDFFYQQEKFKELCELSLNLFGESMDNLRLEMIRDIEQQIDCEYKTNKYKYTNKNSL